MMHGNDAQWPGDASGLARCSLPPGASAAVTLLGGERKRRSFCRGFSVT